MAVLKKYAQDKPKQILMNFKVTSEERARIIANAVKYTNGNITAWLRYAAIDTVPPKKDLAK